jgi:hypothetical protein
MVIQNSTGERLGRVFRGKEFSRLKVYGDLFYSMRNSNRIHISLENRDTPSDIPHYLWNTWSKNVADTEKKLNLMQKLRFFRDNKDTVRILKETTNLESLIKKVAMFAQYKGSINETEKTPPGHRRSSQDIYRHIRSIRDDIPLREVMRVLANSTLMRNYCSDVERLVFHHNHYMLLREHIDCFDEFGGFIKMWGYKKFRKNIFMEEEK